MNTLLKSYIIVCAITILLVYLWLPHWLISAIFAFSFTLSWFIGGWLNKVLGVSES